MELAMQENLIESELVVEKRRTAALQLQVQELKAQLAEARRISSKVQSSPAHFGPAAGASRVACEFFDRLAQQTGLVYPHVHMTPHGTVGHVVGGLIPGR